VLDEIKEAPGIVLFTLLEKDLVSGPENKWKEINVPSLSIVGPVMQLFEAYLGAADGTCRCPARVQCRIFQAHRRFELHNEALSMLRDLVN
jgi:hypothetical protein